MSLAKKLLKGVAKLLVLVPATASVILPLLWVLSTSLKTPAALYEFSTPFFTQHATTDNYILLRDRGFHSWVGISLAVSSLSALVTLVLAVPFAYYLTRFMKINPRRDLKNLILLPYLLPPIFLAISIKQIYGEFFASTILMLAFVYPILQFPISVWILEGTFRRIPRELEDAIVIDGGGFWRIVLHVLLPVGRGGILVALVFSWWIAWCDYSLVLLLKPAGTVNTITTGIASLHTGDAFEWGGLMAGGIYLILLTLPSLVVASHFVQISLSRDL